MAKVTNHSAEAFRTLDPHEEDGRGRRLVVIGPGQDVDVSDELAASLKRQFPETFAARKSTKAAARDTSEEDKT